MKIWTLKSKLVMFYLGLDPCFNETSLIHMFRKCSALEMESDSIDCVTH